MNNNINEESITKQKLMFGPACYCLKACPVRYDRLQTYLVIISFTFSKDNLKTIKSIICVLELSNKSRSPEKCGEDSTNEFCLQ